ncbi:MAG: Rieske 2Fe-2S domain-containing protein [bacterium]|nr:Rieske 2Fe-2S domain-containing protein [bacterium]
MTAPDPASLLHPVAAGADLMPRHVVRSRLLGRRLAIWKADDGFVNVWEDRCIHRGMRLSAGVNDGAELVCQYHGWRYSNRNGNCVYIPAHPGEAPAGGLRVATFACAEKYGLVWSGGSPDAEPPSIPALEGGEVLVLRSLPVNAPAALVLEGLAGYSFRPTAALGTDTPITTSADAGNPHSVTVTATTTGAESSVVFFIQPAEAGRCVIRPVLSAAPAPEERLATLRHHARALEELRAQLEDSSPAEAAVALPLATLEPLRSGGTAGAAGGRHPQLQVRVARKWVCAEGIAAFDLAPVAGELPSFQPGAHLDVHLPNGLVRQYSLTNGPDLTGVYRIGVKLVPEGGGGSRCMHQSVHEGDALDISTPRNNFTLRRDAARTLLIAGGIGITPLLAMAQTLARQGLTWELHYFAQSDDHVAFDEMLAPLAEGVTTYCGLSPQETGAELTRITRHYGPMQHAYLCGPGPMIDTARSIAAEAGWPTEAVHFEYFKNESARDDSSAFDVTLARRDQTLRIGAGMSLLNGLRNAGIDLPSSCEQGACGTCIATVLGGEPDHQDVYLNDSERAAANRMLTCVSRAKSGQLVLDL